MELFSQGMGIAIPIIFSLLYLERRLTKVETKLAIILRQHDLGGENE